VATLADIEQLGYTVTEVTPGICNVAGYGREWQIHDDDQDSLDVIADPDLHAARVRNYTDPPPPPTQQNRARLSQIRGQLADAYHDTLQPAYQNWATLTNQQKDQALRANVRATMGLMELFENFFGG
jgi:hypothetical protein